VRGGFGSDNVWPLKVPRRWPRRIVLTPWRMKNFPGEVKILRGEISGIYGNFPENSRRILATAPSCTFIIRKKILTVFSNQFLMDSPIQELTSYGPLRRHFRLVILMLSIVEPQTSIPSCNPVLLT
jgi:hypothetical protein